MSLRTYKNLTTDRAPLSFLYLQLHSAMLAHGVPWGTLLVKHSLHEVLVKNINNNGIISVLYKYITKYSYKPLSLDNMWRKDIIVLQILIGILPG